MKDPIRPCVQEKCPNKKQRTQGLIYRTNAKDVNADAGVTGIALLVLRIVELKVRSGRGKIPEKSCLTFFVGVEYE